MSRYYAEIKGNRGAATRQGTKRSGVYGNIRGWNIGAAVEVFPDPTDDDLDCVRVHITGGSNQPLGLTLIEIREDGLLLYSADGETIGKSIQIGRDGGAG